LDFLGGKKQKKQIPELKRKHGCRAAARQRKRWRKFEPSLLSIPTRIVRLLTNKMVELGAPMRT